MLKPIETEFHSEVNKNGKEALVQFIIDDNIFNSMSSVFVSVDRMFSSREIGAKNEKAQPFLEMLTTTSVGMVLPQFTEEYGSGKKIDLVFSPSHNMFLDGFPESKMSGIYMDKNGNWKFQINLSAQINVESLPGVWDPVRNIYMTMVFKMKITTDDSNPFDKKFVFLPKNLEITQLKVLKDNEEMVTEQMLIQSMANIQFEQAKKLF